ncbi:8-amino-7-oxononanoate synthase, partial [Aduncisulcus paluster]
MRIATDTALDEGVWLRPFRTLIYAMPPYICDDEEIRRITQAMVRAAAAEAPVTDASSPLAWLGEVERQREVAGLRRRLRTRSAAEPEIDLASNDYLGLSRHPQVIEAGVEALRIWGAGSTGSRLVTGNTELHEELERELATFMGAQSALVFSSGYTANLGAVVALSGPGTLIVSDARTHASLIDACRLSRARVVVTPYRDTQAVAAALAQRPEERALVLTDAVFSADGALAPLTELYAVCRDHSAVLLVDEAHGLGVRGPGGRGLAVRAHLIDAARPFIFDTGLAPAAAGSALAALRLLAVEPERVRAVLDHAAALGQWCGVAEKPESAVVPVILGDPTVAFNAAKACLEQGVRVGCFRPPSVPEGQSLLRLTARASLTEADLDRVREVLAGVLALARHQGIDVTVCKPVQTGDDRDADEVARLSGVRRVQTLVRYPEPLAPVA